MQGFLSRDGLPPAQLLEIGRAEVRGYGVEIVHGTVESIEPGFIIDVAGGPTLTARRVLVTTGSVDELPDIAGVRARWGRDLLHCPYCHGWEVRDQPLGVLWTGPGSVQHALLVRQWSADVVYFAHTSAVSDEDERQLAARGVRVVHGEVARLHVVEDAVRGVVLVDGRLVQCEAVFVRPGNAPRPDGLLAGLGVATDEIGFPVVDRSGLTSVPGVWVAGNAVDPRQQVITAAGAGSAAAIAINADLVREDVDLAVSVSA